MPSINVVDMAGNKTGTMKLADNVFAVSVSEAVLHTAVRAYLMNQRQGTHATLTRSEVSGGGKKPWKQKGTGRARQGSTRSPQWTHGGIVFGPQPRTYHVTLNKKVRRAALLGAMSAKLADHNMIVVKAIATEEYKTKNMTAMLSAIGAGKKALVVLDKVDPIVVKSCANIPGVKTTVYNSLNVYDVMNCDSIVFAQAAVKKIQEVYAK